MTTRPYNDNPALQPGPRSNSGRSMANAGYPLIYSNNQEALKGPKYGTQACADYGAYLYRDTNKGRTRVFAYHYNTLGYDLNGGIQFILRNNNTFPINIWMFRNGQGVAGDGPTAGANSWAGWFNTGIKGADGIVKSPGTDTFVARIEAGASYVLLKTDAMPNLTIGQAVADFYGVGADSSRADYGAAVPVEVNVCAVISAPNAISSLFDVKPDPDTNDLPAKGNGTHSDIYGESDQYFPITGTTTYNYGDYAFEHAVRGTFPYCSRTMTINYNTNEGPKYVEFVMRHTNDDKMIGEQIAGTDKTPTGGNKQVWAPYGYDMQITVNFTDGALKTIWSHLQNRKEGGNRYVINVDGVTLQTFKDPNDVPQPFLAKGHAYNFEYRTLNGGSQTANYILTTCGGHGGTIELEFNPAN